MKRATLAAVAMVASLGLAACHSGSSSRPEATGGAVKAETTTSSSTTTTQPDMTGTTRVPAARVSQPVLAADCPGAVALEGTAGSANRNSLQMVSAEKGFAVDATTVLVTDDGRTWTRRHTGSEPMFSVDALDADHAWAVGQNVVLATSDGGRGWRPVSEPDQGMLRIVDFVDPQNGWGATAGHLYRTADGGLTWTRIDAPCGGEAVCFTGPDDGWAAEGPHVYRSTDGGETWQAAFTVPSDGIDLPFNPQSIHASQLQCARPGVAWVYFTAAGSGSHVGYAAYRGTAAGQWTPVMKEPQAGPRGVSAPAGGSSPAPMSAVGADTAVLLSFTPLASPPGGLELREATDGGRRLGPARAIPGLFSAMAVDFLSPDVGWVIGAKAGSTPIDAILATTDGGQTWREQYSYTIPPPAG
jgi:photosystem II stability/assembly factor-like uncharacterized protein